MTLYTICLLYTSVTNAIIHGYECDESKVVIIEASICEDEISITVEDNGIGIENLEEAREPLYTSKPELERSGMGFTVMETFMDSLEVYSEKDKGTKIIMKKKMNT